MPDGTLDLDSDERSGDLGDAYAALGEPYLAEGAWAVARILDPDDSEWQGHSPTLDLAAWATEMHALDEDFRPDIDEWVGDLGDKAAEQGWTSAAHLLYVRASDLDPDDEEWQRKAGGSQ